MGIPNARSGTAGYSKFYTRTIFLQTPRFFDLSYSFSSSASIGAPYKIHWDKIPRHICRPRLKHLSIFTTLRTNDRSSRPVLRRLQNLPYIRRDLVPTAYNGYSTVQVIYRDLVPAVYRTSTTILFVKTITITCTLIQTPRWQRPRVKWLIARTPI